MKRLLLFALFLLVVVSLGTTMLLAPAFAPHAAAYDGKASATMSCTDNPATRTRIALVTMTWSGVKDGGYEVTSVYDVALESDNATPLTSGNTQVSPPQEKGTASVTLSFSDTAPFGFVQWEIFANPIAPIHAGELDASNFPGCPYP
jgi:hypothetical protein